MDKASKRTLRKKVDNDLLESEVRDYPTEFPDVISIFAGMTDSGGFESRNVSEGFRILKNMNDDQSCTKFLSFVGALVSTGVRGIIRNMLKNKMFDCVITTCGALDHDIARTYEKYYAGRFEMNDKILLRKKIHRLGNVLVPTQNYGPLIEEKTQTCFNNLYHKDQKKDVSSYEVADYIGSTLDESSFLYWAHKNKIPVIVPGLVDGAVGSQLSMFHQTHRDFRLDVLKDQTKLSDLIYEAKRTGALMVGGGISKHHTLWWNQFRGGLDYAVYITTASEWDGSLSGALVSEAISWGKVTYNAAHTTIHAEATILLPFLYAALNDYNKRRKLS
jgi:deoxyhypusine synthase